MAVACLGKDIHISSIILVDSKDGSKLTIFKNSFINVITDLFSGMKISGQVTSLSSKHLTIKTLVQAYHSDKRTHQRAEQLSFHSIAIDSIISLTQLDASYPPKLAYDWSHKQCKNEIWMVEVEMDKNTKITGQLLEASEGFKSCGFTPLTFYIATDPNKTSNLTKVSINDIKSMRKLSYTPQSILSLEKDRRQLIENTLEPIMVKVLVSLVMTYLSGDIPDELPEVCFDFLMKKSKVEFNGSK